MTITLVYRYLIHQDCGLADRGSQGLAFLDQLLMGRADALVIYEPIAELLAQQCNLT